MTYSKESARRQPGADTAKSTAGDVEDDGRPALYPRSVLVGARRIITEAPAAWLARVGRKLFG